MNENGFLIRSFGWQELAVLYAPELTKESAGRRLTKWVEGYGTLKEALLRNGWRKGQRLLTPLQVRTIVCFIGEP